MLFPFLTDGFVFLLPEPVHGKEFLGAIVKDIKCIDTEFLDDFLCVNRAYAAYEPASKI